MARKPKTAPDPPKVYNFGKPCGSCMWLPNRLIGSGVAMCGQNHGYQRPDSWDRPFDCEDHEEKDLLVGLIEQLKEALIWNRIARQWLNGTNVGTPDDPRHESSRGKALIRAVVEINDSFKAHRDARKLAEGTGL